MKISVIIPVYNEEKTIKIILDKVEEQKDLIKEIIIIDDHSSDNSLKIIQNYNFKSKKKILRHPKNSGKGSCIKSAKKYITGEIVLIQDADLEYEPSCYIDLIRPILENRTNVVYGSRILGKNRYKLDSFISIFRIFANHALTIISNFINKQKLTDAHTCYKVVKSDIFKKITLEHDDFSFCPELTTKLSNIKEKIIEVPILYNGRTNEEGKKIRFIDGLIALKTLIKFKFLYFNFIK